MKKAIGISILIGLALVLFSFMVAVIGIVKALACVAISMVFTGSMTFAVYLIDSGD